MYETLYGIKNVYNSNRCSNWESLYKNSFANYIEYHAFVRIYVCTYGICNYTVLVHILVHTLIYFMHMPVCIYVCMLYVVCNYSFSCHLR